MAELNRIRSSLGEYKNCRSVDRQTMNTKYDTFSNKENAVWLVLGCINDFLSFVFSSGRRASKYYPWASPERQIQPKKQFSAGGENRGRRARALESL